MMKGISDEYISDRLLWQMDKHLRGCSDPKERRTTAAAWQQAPPYLNDSCVHGEERRCRKSMRKKGKVFLS